MEGWVGFDCRGVDWEGLTVEGWWDRGGWGRLGLVGCWVDVWRTVYVMGIYGWG